MKANLNSSKTRYMLVAEPMPKTWTFDQEERAFETIKQALCDNHPVWHMRFMQSQDEGETWKDCTPMLLQAGDRVWYKEVCHTAATDIYSWWHVNDDLPNMPIMFDVDFVDTEGQHVACTVPVENIVWGERT